MAIDGLEVQWTSREVVWTLQTREEVAEDNIGFFRFLVEQVGQEIAEPWISKYLDQVEGQIRARGEPGKQVTGSVDMVQLGGGLTFWPYLNSNKTFNANVVPQPK